jgi:hypothetical protein
VCAGVGQAHDVEPQQLRTAFQTLPQLPNENNTWWWQHVHGTTCEKVVTHFHVLQ